MKRVGLIVAVVLTTVAVLLAGIGLLLPNRWTVTRALSVNASAKVIHPYVEDLQRWPQWADLLPPDPDLKVNYSNPSRGPGATVQWHGPRAGSGEFKVLRSSPEHGVFFESQLGGHEQKGGGSITYAAGVGLTEITWKDSGRLPPIIGGFLRDDLEERLGFRFEAALKRLKKLAERDAQAAATGR